MDGFKELSTCIKSLAITSKAQLQLHRHRSFMDNYDEFAALLSQKQSRLLDAQKKINDDFHSNNVGQKWGRNKVAALLLRRLKKGNYQQSYHQWLRKNLPSERKLAQQRKGAERLAYKPTISIVMPTFNTPISYLTKAIDSVLAQTYRHWELCIADDYSESIAVKEVLSNYEKFDARIKILFRQENGHISNASNSALSLAKGDFIGLLDHDDLLTADALYEVALLLNKHPDADMIYSDEDKIGESGELSTPFFKPDWAPDSFLSRMYTSHFGVYRRSLVEKIGGFRQGYEGAQDYDLVLRLTEVTEKIHHISKVLYHWRIHAGSTADSIFSKDYATGAARRAIEDALNRRDEPGQVIPTSGGHHIVRYQIKKTGKVVIIIPTRDLGDTLNTCLSSIFEKTLYQDYEVLLIDNGSTEKRALDVIDFWADKYPDKFRCEKLDIPFNYSTINNTAVAQSESEYLLFLNNDTEVITSGWIAAMVEQAQRPSIGAVGVKLLYPDDTIQHAGVICIGGVAGHGHKQFPSTAAGYFYQLQTVNNYSAVTAACLMCRREVFEAVGGFNENLQVAFNDVDLCFNFLELGYRNVYIPHVSLYHYESKSRGYETTPSKKERFASEIRYMRERWIEVIENDRYYSRNLTSRREDYSIGI